ncbi:MCE family protein [Mycobacterium colombiense]|uniref:MCE family protein n=1 Tax=Mycobacterium colombiense TaxID=339268 RepID=UPI00096D4C6E|nr:MCE family protein [Mycobacterium colombiense]OMB94505.1 mammalian cell entry protein [Mycobacterium colombiense]
MTGTGRIMVKFGIFATVMLMLTTFLFFIFGQFRNGPTHRYSAIFVDASQLKTGDSVRVAGIRVGTVNGIALQPDNKVVVDFDADDDVALTTGTRAAVRYLNLVGDRYLELIIGPGSMRVLPAGSQISIDHTMPSLDLDMLLGGLKPVIRGLNPQDVNALAGALLQIFQGQGQTLQSLLAKTSSFSNDVAEKNKSIETLIDNLNTVVRTLADQGGQFSGAIERLQRLVTDLAHDRDPIGDAIQALATGTASVTDLLGAARPPLAGTVDQLNRLAPLLEQGKGRLDDALQRAPNNFRKLARTGAYGSFVNYYICGLTFRVTDLQGRTAVYPWFKQTEGRCAEP